VRGKCAPLRLPLRLPPRSPAGAPEITTHDGNTPTVNVWGHSSYTVEFRRTPDANELWVVTNDPAGVSACGEPRHIHHEPDHQ